MLSYKVKFSPVSTSVPSVLSFRLFVDLNDVYLQSCTAL